MHVYLYIHNKYTQHTHTLCTQKLLLWIQLITINHCPALKIINFFTPTFHNPINSQCTKSPTFQFILIKQPVSLRNAPSYRTKISCAPISFWFQITTSLKSSRRFIRSIDQIRKIQLLMHDRCTRDCHFLDWIQPRIAERIHSRPCHWKQWFLWQRS